MRSSSSSFKWMNFKGSQAPGLKSYIIIWALTARKWSPDHNPVVLIFQEKAPPFAARDLPYWHFLPPSFARLPFERVHHTSKVNNYPESERIKNSLAQIVAEDDQAMDKKKRASTKGGGSDRLCNSVLKHWSHLISTLFPKPPSVFTLQCYLLFLTLSVFQFFSRIVIYHLVSPPP